MIRTEGWRPETFTSAHEFLARPRVQAPSCLILDVSLPDLNGLDLQKQIAGDRTDMPIIFITGYGDIPMTVQAMKAGAVEFLTKPFAQDALVGAIRQAIDRSHRIGQTEPVTAWRIIAAQTIDARIAELIDSKAGLAARALDGSDEEVASSADVQLEALVALLTEALT